MMQTRQLRDGMTQEERREVSHAYGEMYHNAAVTASTMKFPKIDWKDPCSVAAVYDQMQAMKLFAIDYSQTKENFTREPGNPAGKHCSAGDTLKKDKCESAKLAE